MPKYTGPNSADIRTKIYHDPITNECYRFVPQVYICPESILTKNILKDLI